ncbi:hypothetical protein JCM6882_008726 [Rhodosporidiobolus microsporus]
MLRRSLQLTRLAHHSHRRLASSSASSLPRAAPTDKQPFTAPSSSEKGPDTTREQGGLGQVKFPDMAEIEKEVEHVVSIPSAPDSYRSSSSPSSASSSSSDAPSSTGTDEKVVTVSHPSTYAGGGPSLNSQGDDVQTGQAGDSTSALPKDADRSKEGGEGGGGGRPLNEEEVKGLWRLLGIVAGGLVVGTVTDPAWRRGEKKKNT